MIPSLAPCFTGNLLRFKDALALQGQHASSMAGRDLLDPPVIDGLLSQFADAFPGGDRRALVSMWTQWHFGVVMIPVTMAVVLLGRDLPVELSRVRIAVENGRAAAVILPEEGSVFGPHASGRFARLVDGHVAPLIDHFAHHFGSSPRLLWANAATTFEWTLKQACAFDRVGSAALAEGYALLESQADHCGRPNPMYGALRYREEAGQVLPLRKICCLRYLLPGMADCGSLCPIPARSR